MREQIIGILGGMGPEATCEVFRRIIKLTEAKSDSEHLRVIIDNNPKIPDRTKALLGNGISPIDEMRATANNLQNAGADFIIIPCMTAHSFIDQVQKIVQVPILNGLELTDRYISNIHPELKRIGLIATSGTISMGLFQRYLTGCEIIVPKDELQDEVMDIIYGINGIKAGNTSTNIVDRIKKVIERLKKEKEVEGVIAGCTEIGLVMTQSDADIPLIDPLNVIAEEAVKRGKLKVF